MYADVTRYEFRRDYYEMLSQVFLRDELKLNNVALCPEEMEVNLGMRKSVDFNMMDSHIERQGMSIKSTNQRVTAVKPKMQLPPESAGAAA